MIELLITPFLACILLVLIHVYFGAFVLRRGILFIDLALAQWAALGYVVGTWKGVESQGGLFMCGFLFTVVAAILLSRLQPIYNKNNLQEAVIGVMYIMATAAATGLISSTGMEGHHLKEMLAGHILFIQPSEVIQAFTLYAVIAFFMKQFHGRFLNRRSKRWDFLFYLLFGAVVTSSVKMVGILLVFSFLVIPLLSITLIVKTFKNQVITGWLVGIVASLLGLALSLRLDIPPSYCVILVLCSIWLISSFRLLAKNQT